MGTVLPVGDVIMGLQILTFVRPLTMYAKVLSNKHFENTGIIIAVFIQILIQLEKSICVGSFWWALTKCPICTWIKCQDLMFNFV